MYSGTTLNNFSGSLVGTHQKIDRVAYRILGEATGLSNFPPKKLIIHFEGKNGPDGIKSKSPAQNEPWHFFDPFDIEDTTLIDTINEHYKHLVRELKKGNMERSAFEAAWLAHAMVDGLTPAHHFPFEQKLSELRSGESMETRNSLKEKMIMKGDTKKEFIANNWKWWGMKGVIISHGMFELGVAAIITPLQYKKIKVTKADERKMRELGLGEYYQRLARRIAVLNLYDEYLAYGWTVKLTKQVRDVLVPEVIHLTALVWYSALKEAGKLEKVKHASK